MIDIRLRPCSSYARCFIKAPDIWDTLHHINPGLSCSACIFRMRRTVKRSHRTRTFLPDFYLLKYWGHIDWRDICCEDAVEGTLVMLITGSLYCKWDRIVSLFCYCIYIKVTQRTNWILCMFIIRHYIWSSLQLIHYYLLLRKINGQRVTTNSHCTKV